MLPDVFAVPAARPKKALDPPLVFAWPAPEPKKELSLAVFANPAELPKMAFPEPASDN